MGQQIDELYWELRARRDKLDSDFAEGVRSAAKSGEDAGRAYGQGVQKALRAELKEAGTQVGDTITTSAAKTDKVLKDLAAENTAVFEKLRADQARTFADLDTRIGKLNDSAGELPQKTGLWNRALRTTLALFVALGAIRLISRFIQDAVELALAYDKATGSVRRLQDSVAGASEAWLTFKRAVGIAVIELAGGERTMNALAAAARVMQSDLEGSQGTINRLGQVAATTLEILVRFFAALASGSEIISGTYNRTLERAAELHLLVARSILILFESMGATGVAGRLSDHISNVTTEIQRLRKEADAAFEAARKNDAIARGEIPTVTGQGATTKRLIEEAKKAAKERLAIEEQLQDRIAQITADTTDEALIQLDRLEKAYLKAGGTLSGKVGEQFRQLKQQIVDTAGFQNLSKALDEISAQRATPSTVRDLERLRDRVIEYREQIDKANVLWDAASGLIKDVERAVADIEVDALTESIRSQFDITIGILKERLANDIIDEKAFERQARIAGEIFNNQILETIGKLRSEGKLDEATFVALTDLLKGDDTKQRSRTRELEKQARAIEAAGRSAIALAEAFGLADSHAASMLQSVLQVATSVPLAATGDPTAIANVIAGGLSLIGGLLGDSPAEQARRESLRRNTEALNQLRDQLKANPLSGGNLAAVRQALAASRVTIQSLRTLEGGGPDSAQDKAIERILDKFRDAGISLDELKRIAKEFGIELFRDGKLTSDGLKALAEATGIAIDALFKFANTAAGARERSEFEAQIFDRPDTPEARAQRELDILREKAPELFEKFFAGIDPNTAEGRRRLEEAQRQLARDILNGLVEARALGELTDDEVLEILRNIDASTDAMAENAGSTGGFAVVRTITEVTANRMIGVLSSIALYTQRSTQLEAGILQQLGGRVPFAISPPAVPVSATSQGAGGITITFDDIVVQISASQVPAATDQRSGEVVGYAIGTGITRALEENASRALGNATINYRRAKGELRG